MYWHAQSSVSILLHGLDLQPRRRPQILAGKGYEILDEGRIPLVIRETCRKYQLILAHRLVARKRSA